MSANEDNEEEKKLWPIPILLALVITVIIFALGSVIFCTKEVWHLRGNEIGDFFAGFSGALSFVWIIATIFLQKEELALQRREVTRLADEARGQNISLLVAAKTNFQVRFKTITNSFYQNHMSTLVQINKDISRIYSHDSSLIAGLQKFADERYSSNLQIEGSQIEHIYLKVKSIESKQARLKFEVELLPTNNDPLTGTTYCSAILEVPIESLQVRDMLVARNVSVEEIELLVQEASSLNLLPSVRSVSLVGDDESDLRSIQANAMIKCLINEIVAVSL